MAATTNQEESSETDNEEIGDSESESDLDVIIELADLRDDVSSDAVEEAVEEVLEKKGIDPSDVDIDLCDLSDGFVTIEAEDSEQA